MADFQRCRYECFLKKTFPGRIKRTALFLDAVLVVSLLKAIFEIAVYKNAHDIVNIARIAGCASWRLMARIPDEVCAQVFAVMD